jgi:hypothetical protein
VVAVAWYDRREDVTRRCWKKYVAVSLDGGVTFSRNIPVSSQSSCPPKDAAPSLIVKNAVPDTALPPVDSVEKLVLAQRFAEAEQLNLAWERRRAEAGIRGPRLHVSFDRSRGTWPGHYTGLAADSTGAFHALWSDRRSGYQQLYSARLEVQTGADPAPPALADTIVDHLVEIVASGAKFDEATGTTTLDVQLRNASSRTIYGPLRVRPTRAVFGATRVGEAVADSGGTRRDDRVVWDFSGLLGTRDRLEPGEVSETRAIRIRHRPALGLDVALEMEVVGRLARP